MKAKVQRTSRMAIATVLGAVPCSLQFRATLLRSVQITAGPGCRIAGGLSVTGNAPIRLGKECFINFGCHIDAEAPVVLGDGVFLADHVRLLTATHDIGSCRQRAGPWRAESVEIGAGSWLGSGAVVLPGVSVAAGCVIGAGALISADTASNGLYLGVPGRRVRDLD